MEMRGAPDLNHVTVESPAILGGDDPLRHPVEGLLVTKPSRDRNGRCCLVTITPVR